MVDVAEFVRAWFRAFSLSVWIGQDELMAKPASKMAWPSVSQASTRLCVNITVSTPAGSSTR